MLLVLRAIEEGDRHQHGESADVLHKGREYGDRTDEYRHLDRGGRQVGSNALEDVLDDTGALDRRAHQKRRGNDDDDVVGETGECSV